MLNKILHAIPFDIKPLRLQSISGFIIDIPSRLGSICLIRIGVKSEVVTQRRLGEAFLARHRATISADVKRLQARLTPIGSYFPALSPAMVWNRCPGFQWAEIGYPTTPHEPRWPEFRLFSNLPC